MAHSIAIPAAQQAPKVQFDWYKFLRNAFINGFKAYGAALMVAAPNTACESQPSTNQSEPAPRRHAPAKPQPSPALPHSTLVQPTGIYPNMDARMTPHPATLNLIAGWLGMLAGVLSGAVLGLFFHREDWMGGYGSYRRRLARLGHIAFFGLGFLNLIFAATIAQLPLTGQDLTIASWALIVGAATMPFCCFLSAWRKPLRHLFPIPVLSVTTGLLAILIGGWPR